MVGIAIVSPGACFGHQKERTRFEDLLKNRCPSGLGRVMAVSGGNDMPFASSLAQTVQSLYRKLGTKRQISQLLWEQVRRHGGGASVVVAVAQQEHVVLRFVFAKCSG